MSNPECEGERLWVAEIWNTQNGERVWVMVEAEVGEGQPGSAASILWELFPPEGDWTWREVLPYEERGVAMAQATASALRAEQEHSEDLESHLLSIQDTLAGAISDASQALQR